MKSVASGYTTFKLVGTCVVLERYSEMTVPMRYKERLAESGIAPSSRF